MLMGTAVLGDTRSPCPPTCTLLPMATPRLRSILFLAATNTAAGAGIGMLQQPGWFSLWVSACGSGSVAVSRLTTNQTKGRGDMICSSARLDIRKVCGWTFAGLDAPGTCACMSPMPEPGVAVRAATAGPHL